MTALVNIVSSAILCLQLNGTEQPIRYLGNLLFILVLSTSRTKWRGMFRGLRTGIKRGFFVYQPTALYVTATIEKHGARTDVHRPT